MKGLSRFTKIVLTMTCAFVVTGILPCAATAQDSPWLLRVRFLNIAPDDDSSTITGVGGKAEVDDAYTADVDLSYFFSDNVAAELTATIAEHDVEAKGTALGTVDLGSVSILPPTLTLQYHLMPDSNIRPYVGAGVTYVFFYDDDPPRPLSIDYDDEFGWALQAGVDIGLDENWAINLDVKKIWLSTDVSVGTPIGTVKTEVDVDPWLFGVGVAYRF